MQAGYGKVPMGSSAIRGRGFGVCTGANAVRFGAGRGRGRGQGRGQGLGLGLGCGRGFRMNSSSEATVIKSQKEFFEEQKDLLQNKLNHISKQLESLLKADK